MALTKEEADKIKEHLLKQLDSFPEDKRKQIKEQIESMTTEEVENFVKQNQLTHLGDQCIFCSIVAGKTPTIKIGEDDQNLAVLELNPLSKGHTLIIPFSHEDGPDNSSKLLADQISKKLQREFSPKKIQKNEIEIMGHKLLEIIPLYGNETNRKKATEAELRKIQEQILKPIKIEKPEPEKKKKEFKELPKLPPRIP